MRQMICEKDGAPQTFQTSKTKIFVTPINNSCMITRLKWKTTGFTAGNDLILLLITLLRMFLSSFQKVSTAGAKSGATEIKHNIVADSLAI